MNELRLKGTIVRNGVVNEKTKKALKFTVKTKADELRGMGISFVPCVLFDPKQDIENLLCLEGAGLVVEITGYIKQFVYEVNGAKRYSVEVVVDPSLFSITGRGKDELLAKY